MAFGRRASADMLPPVLVRSSVRNTVVGHDYASASYSFEDLDFPPPSSLEPAAVDRGGLVEAVPFDPFSIIGRRGSTRRSSPAPP